MYFDLALEELKKYFPLRQEPDNFDEFWKVTINQAKKDGKKPSFVEVDFGLSMINTYDLTFSGYAQQPVKGWLLIPKNVKNPLPCVINFIGYGGGRGLPHDWLLYPNVGYASLVMDTRGQGSAWLQGDTPDLPIDGSSPQYPGFMTLGILDPKTYYYRRVYTDAVQAVNSARSHPLIDAHKLVVTGSSQGGGIALAVAGLVNDLAAVMPDVPFLSHFERAVSITDEKPYNEISNFLKVHRNKKDLVFETLAYFDGMHFAVRANAPALFSVGLMDTICPPSTVFASYNHYSGEKAICIYDFNEHEGGGSQHDLEKIKFLKKLFS